MRELKLATSAATDIILIAIITALLVNVSAILGVIWGM
jgi:hypothetical protein